MKGKYNLVVKNNKISYELSLERSITVIQGNSGSGKTYLISLLRDWKANGRDSGVTVKCDCDIEVFDGLTRWESFILELENTIIFVDEGVRYLYTREFAERFLLSDCYLVFISRRVFPQINNLPFAVNALLKFETNHSSTPAITTANVIYQDKWENVTPEILITEDSNSGFEFMSEAYKDAEVQVVSASGNSNVPKKVLSYVKENKKVCAIVDGAAFGNYIGQMMDLRKFDVHVFAPESFEWLLLNTKMFSKNPAIVEQLKETYNYCDSKEFITWERFYEHILKIASDEMYNVAYSKKSLDKIFLSEKMLIEVKEMIKNLQVKGEE